MTIREHALPHGLRVLTITAGQGGFDETVVEPTDAVLNRLRSVTASGEAAPSKAAILLLRSPHDDPRVNALHEALFEALRGIVGALTLEYPRRLHLNLVRATTPDDARTTLDLLDDEFGGFIAGATLDLNGEFE